MRAGMQRGGVGEAYRSLLTFFFPCSKLNIPSSGSERDVFFSLSREFLRDRLGMRGGLLRFWPNLSKEG